MKIKSLTLENFRTFYGETRIDFSSDIERSVTIFIGENGSGKTTILNAIYWAFTGEFTEQFKDPIALINKDAKQEGCGSCSVAIEFYNDAPNAGERFELTRTHKEGSRNNELVLQKINSDGARVPIAIDMGQIVIERYIPKKLANWFIFDGEAINSMHLNGDPKFKEELFQTFGFSNMMELKGILDKIEVGYFREERKLINSEELDKIGAQIDRYEEAINICEKQVKNLGITLSQKKRKSEALKHQLNNLPQSQPIQNQKERAVIRKKEAEALRDRKEKARNQFVGLNAPKTILLERLSALNADLKARGDNQKLPHEHGTLLVDNIIETGVCICGTPVLPGSSEENHLLKSNEKAANGQLQERIFLLRAEIGKYVEQANAFEDLLSPYIDEIASYESQIADQEEIIRQSDKKIAEIPNEEIQKIRNELAAVEQEIELDNRELGGCLSKLSDFKEKISADKYKQEQILAEQGRSSDLKVKREKVSRLIKYVSEQFDRQQVEVLDALNREVSGVLIQYLTKNFTAEIDSTSYAVRTRDIDRRITSLSTGETNVLKFALIAAIVGLAANRTTLGKVNWISEPITAPLIFDAPFSVVDGEYRASVATNLAKLASQLVLLFDAGKWDSKLENLLSVKVGKIYRLVSNAKGSDKSTQKSVCVKDIVYDLNRYNCERDETKCVEIVV